MLRLLGHCPLLAGDLPRFAFLRPRAFGDPRNGLAPQRHAQVVAALSQFECGRAGCPLPAFGTNSAEEKRRLALSSIESGRILEFRLALVETALMPPDHP